MKDHQASVNSTPSPLRPTITRKKKEIDHEIDHEIGHEIDHEIGHEIDHEIDHEIGHEIDHEIGHEIDHEIGHEIDHEIGHEIGHEIDYEIAVLSLGVNKYDCRKSMGILKDSYVRACLPLLKQVR
ncbi:hypothetical protein, conserved [Plasmodium ovale wallikeri]|uniref:Uncharacterized protein n=1 Tax=Plasmodium ovale wallikeri TaxID=864142 RepID=A0A1A8YX53_PLAOA|nr:hypothetical protein, conserved [Plasmodium ovale wallikeri]